MKQSNKQQLKINKYNTPVYSTHLSRQIKLLPYEIDNQSNNLLADIIKIVLQIKLREQMKSPKGYWHMRKSSKSVNYRSSAQRNDNQLLQASSKPTSLSKEYEMSINQLQKRAETLQMASKKILKMEQFYQLMCSGQFSAMGIRCYEHNNELILYCVNDHKLLCANCMYYSNIQTPKHAVEANDKSGAQRNKKASQINSNNKHFSHDVRQISKAAREINSNLGRWQNEYREEVNFMTACKIQWEKQKQSYQELKRKLQAELDKQYDKLQMQLSKLYLDTKKELNDISLPYAEHLDSIIQSYKNLSKLIIPNRYPIPTAKHSWFYLMKNKIFTCTPMRVQDITDTWLRIFDSHSKVIIRKFAKAKSANNDGL